MRHTFDIGGKPHAVWLSRSAEEYCLMIGDDRSAVVSLIPTRVREGRLTVNGSSERIAYVVEGDTVHLHLRGKSYAIVGERVTAGTVVAVIESMKLETAIRAAQDGVVEKVHVRAGESFDRDAALVTLSREVS